MPSHLCVCGPERLKAPNRMWKLEAEMAKTGGKVRERKDADVNEGRQVERRKNPLRW